MSQVPPTPPVPAPPQGAPSSSTSGLAIAGLVLAFIIAPVGLILSLIALGRTGPGKQKGRGLAIAGAVISGLSILVGLILIATTVNAVDDATEENAAVQSTTDAETSDAAPPVVNSEVAAPPSTEAAPPSIEAAPPASEEAAPAEPGLPGIGDPATDGEFTFVVTRVEPIGTTVGEGPFAETAQGEFVIVYVTVTNSGNEARTFSSSGQVLYDDQGREYETSSAYFSLPDADKAFLEGINPGNTVTDAPLLYDLAPGTVLERIELHDSFFSEGAEITLR